MKKFYDKVDETFNVERDYKLFRLLQDIVNPTIKIRKSFKDIFINKVKVRVFQANKNKNLIIFIHGGGWSSGSIKSYSKICKKFSEDLNINIISIDYRLAPEHPFPRGFDDCYSVVKEVFNNYKKDDVDTNLITLVGDSAGGNLVSAISQKAHDTKDFKVKNQILFYPCTQMDYSKKTKYKSVIENSKDQFLTRKQLSGFVNLYIKDKRKRNNIYAQPLLAKRMFGLPKTTIIVGTKDPLLDESVAYSKKLRRHFVKSKYYLLQGATHGFLTDILDKRYKEQSIEIMRDLLIK